MKMMKLMLSLLFMLLMGSVAMAQNYTISGTVTDKSSGETLIGATVMDVRSGKGTVTNVNGRYSITLPKDSIELRISFVGYETQMFRFRMKENRDINVALVDNVTMKEVVITSQRPTSPDASQMSAIQVPVEQLKAIPVLFGEADVLKAMQLLPGVQSGGEGMSGMYVRGGGPDENLFLLDGVPLYNVNHLGGFFSAFNADAIKNVTLYKGSFPAHFGGRLSSVLDITSNNGNDKEIHGGVSVGAIATKVFVEGPIIPEKTTFSLSARRTYFDALIQPFLGLSTLGTGLVTTAGYFFYDFNAKVTHKFNENSRLFLSYYQGDDKVYARIKTRDNSFIFSDGFFNEKMFMKLGYNWGNIVGSARWNYVINPRLFMNVTGAYTRYRNNLSVGMEEQYSSGTNFQEMEMEMRYNSGIRDLTGRVDFDFAPNPDHSMRFGTYYIHHIFSPQVLGTKLENFEQDDYEQNQVSIDTTIGESIIQAGELNAYFEDDWSITPALKVNMGVNLSGFAVQSKMYPSIQPRLSGRFLISKDLSVKVGYAYTTQYLHLLSNSSISLPTDLWVPVTARISPMNAHQVAAGVFYQLGMICDLSIEGYYKKMNNLMEYKDGASFWGASTGWEDKVCLGEGWSYGIEFLAQRTFGAFTGWVGYTWSHADRRFDRPGQELSNGLVFPAKYDRRHDLSIVAMYKPNDNFDCSLTWVYCSGNTVTLALQEYERLEDETSDYGWGYYNYNSLSDYGGRNNYRMPAYHRMDASVNFHKKKTHGIRTWNISVYNLYNRKNPYMLYESSGYHYIDGNNTHYGSALVQLSIFPIIPSVSYTFKFTAPAPKWNFLKQLGKDETTINE